MNRGYHMRKPSSRPKATEDWVRNQLKLNIWGGIGWNGAIQFHVIRFGMI